MRKDDTYHNSRMVHLLQEYNCTCRSCKPRYIRVVSAITLVTSARCTSRSIFRLAACGGSYWGSRTHSLSRGEGLPEHLVGLRPQTARIWTIKLCNWRFPMWRSRTSLSRADPAIRKAWLRHIDGATAARLSPGLVTQNPARRWGDPPLWTSGPCSRPPSAVFATQALPRLTDSSTS